LCVYTNGCFFLINSLRPVRKKREREQLLIRLEIKKQTFIQLFKNMPPPSIIKDLNNNNVI
jgi:hypothetical protein